MVRSSQVLYMAGTILLILTLVSAPVGRSQSALQQLQQLGGSMPNVPNVPPPTAIDQDETDWDTSNSGWQQWSNPNDQAQIAALKKQQAEQQKQLEETRKKQQQEEQRRRELEHFWQQVVTQQRQEQNQQQQAQAERQRAFQQAKQTLLINFRVPPVPDIESTGSTPAIDAPVAWSTRGRASFGQITTAAQGPDTGLSATQWRRARQYQSLIETLYQSTEHEPEDDAILAQLESGRNALWAKAVGVIDLPADAREALTLSLPVTSAQGLVPEITQWDIRGMEATAKVMKEISAKMVVPKLLDCVKELDIYSVPELEAVDNAAKTYGKFQTITKIAMLVAKGETSTAIADSVDFIVGALPLPSASTAVNGGRLYSNVAFQATDRFMSDAMKATGATFDSKAFWNDFKNDLNVGQRAVMEFVHYGPQN